ncbi:MAG TPA: ABC transporter permease [Cyclobacteriaceae bacterium]|nr:ABC transporter permease [Cyclobacteriaceae bacterium]
MDNRSKNNGNPPRWADRFLQWYCDPHLLEEIQGDVYELFFRRAAKNKSIADIQFVWDVIRFCRLRNIRKKKRLPHSSFTSTAMIKSYFITGLRNIGRNLAPSLINISGLSIALACAITIFILIDSYYHLDAMHKKGDRIFLVTNKVKGSDEPQHWANAPYKTGPALLQENPGIESIVRIEVERGVSIRHGSAVFNERIWFVEKNFLDVFDFPIVSGDPGALRDKSRIIIVEEMAKKYFGDEDPVGKTLSMKFSSGVKEEFTVGAVAEKISDNSSMFFTFLVSIEKLEDLKLIDTDSWKTFANSTFILFHPGHAPYELSGSLSNIKKLQNEANITWPVSEFELIRLTEVAKRSYDMVNSLSWSNHPMAMVSLGVIAGFLLLLACFNYMNVAVAAVATRLKEIGIRKVTGGGKRDIVNQFMIENLLLCALGLAAGALISYAMLIPAFNSLFSVHVPFSFSSAGTLVAFFAGILIFTAILSGAYPSFYVASFNAVSILKGKEKFGSKSRLSKYLLTLQFVLSFTTIIACLVFTASSYYFETLDWGYDYQQTVVVPVQSGEQFIATKNKALSNPHIISHAGSVSHVGKNSESTTVRINTETMNVTSFLVGFGYLETMNLRLNKGRTFDESIESDKDQAVVINDSFVKKMGWENPIGQVIEIGEKKLQVIGVVSDFHHSDFYFRIEPMIFTIAPAEKFRYFVAKTEPSEVASVSESLKVNWKASFPDDPYSGFQQMEVFEYVFRQNRETNKVFYFISTIALVLSCMGLYGLISYNLTRRLKEFSVRKIFGASIGNIFRLMNRDYLGIVLTAYVVGAPLGFYLMDRMLFAVYPYPLPFQAWPFIVTISLMTATVAITISFQLRRIVNENPTVTLRND